MIYYHSKVDIFVSISVKGNFRFWRKSKQKLKRKYLLLEIHWMIYEVCNRGIYFVISDFIKIYFWDTSAFWQRYSLYSLTKSVETIQVIKIYLETCINSFTVFVLMFASNLVFFFLFVYRFAEQLTILRQYIATKS